MSAQHKRPLLAFLLIVVLCIILLGQAVRSEALVGLLISADRETFGPQQVRLSAVTRDRVVADAPRVRSPRAPAGASATSTLHQPKGTKPHPGRPVARRLGSVNGGGLLAHKPKHAHKRSPPGQAKKQARGDGVPPGQAKRAAKGHAKGHAKKAHGQAKGHAMFEQANPS